MGNCLERTQLQTDAVIAMAPAQTDAVTATGTATVHQRTAVTQRNVDVGKGSAARATTKERAVVIDRGALKIYISAVCIVALIATSLFVVRAPLIDSRDARHASGPKKATP